MMSSAADIPATATEQQRQFALWSRAYDESPNPMLQLEQRSLSPLLPQVSTKDVLDVGCGTGRWLERLADSTPRTLTGVDCSPEMLSRAQQKLARRAVIAVGNATSLPIASTSADVVLASFVASYVPDLTAFAAELRRVARLDGRIYVSDVHPATAIACNWKRAFRSGQEQVETRTYPRCLAEVMASFRDAGFRIACLLEPPFGLPEWETFRRAGKLDAFYAAAGLPAIYILELHPVETSKTFVPALEITKQTITLRGARIALGAETAITADLQICGKQVSSILTSTSDPREDDSVNLDGYLLLPGLINAHDHLEFGLYPNLGRGPYANSAEWASDIQQHESDVIAAQQSVPRDVRLWWGAIRNLLCGVTTVCHHNPLHPELLADDFPVRVVTDYGWAHSLAMDAQVGAKFRAASHESPFVLHACEGLDENSAGEILELDRIGALDARTVLVHGLALHPEGLALLNRRGAALVWCPSSNRFLFGRTLTPEMVAAVDHLLLGSDSPLTATGDLLDEIQIAQREIGLAPGELYRMLFDRAATVFRLCDGEGSIRPNASADIIAVRDIGPSPAETLVNMETADVELVIVRGRVQLASDEIRRRLPPDATAGLYPLELESILRWVRAPLGRLFREAARALGCETTIGGKRVRHVCSAWV